MLHYLAVERRIGVIWWSKRACLVALARRRGRQHSSSSEHQQRRQSRSLPERRGGRKKKYNANISMTIHTWQWAVLGWPNAIVGDTGEGGKHPGKYSWCFAFSDRWTGGGKLLVCYARDVWRTNGLHIRIRLVVLSNFHVQSIFIRVTVYFILIFKV